MIVVVDYGLGNLASIKNMLKHVGVKDVVISSEKSQIYSASKIILPGVGAFDNGMKNLSKLGLIDILNEKALKSKVPFLGICLGMQLMTKGSDEGKLSGLGWFDAYTYKFNLDKDFKIPHMGWNYVKKVKDEAGFLSNNKNYRFYFVHSYYAKCNDNNDILGTTDYSLDFVSCVKKKNIYGAQFHPEKSHYFGKEFLKIFLEHH